MFRVVTLLIIFIISANIAFALEKKSKKKTNIFENSIVDELDQRLLQKNKTKIIIANRDFGLQFYYNNDIYGRTGIIAGNQAGSKSMRSQREILRDFKDTSYGGPRRNTELYGFKMSVPLDK
ncbi:MAG: hypothetical protein ACK5WS_03755 [Alphaproteobacteria bacterium]|jgi:hypothetical protein|nr:hypothetical protein [Candidatus Jidaibacter sp.]